MSTPEQAQRLVAGRYRLRRLLGQGSMGTVWAAYDEYLRRPVAVKEVRLPPGIPQAEADELRERTLREARAIAVLSHPNVITLHDVAREGDEPFVVMEYMPATSLAQLLRSNGPMDTTQAAVVADAVAAGLQAAHEAGITHRDVKPGNVLVGSDGRVKLTDFGIARNVSERTLTRAGIMLGSPAYIAPEIVSGGEVTPRADLWGLGATLFAAVDGRAPYDPDGPVLEILAQVVHGEVPVPNYVGPLRAVIAALMVKDPAARMPLAQVRELLHALQPVPGSTVFATLTMNAPAPPPDAPTVVTAPVAAAPPADLVSSPSLPLAPVPGPLPFGGRQAPRGRGALRTVVLACLAVLLFAGATGGGFALARVVGGAPVLPPARPGPGTSQAAAPVRELVVRSADAATLAGEQGGGFAVPVPRDWVKFVEQRATKTMPNSTRVHWVSPDGTASLVVERFPNFYPDYTVDQYLRVLATRAPGYREVGSTTVTVPGAGTPEPARQLTYRTVEVAADAAAGDANRAAFANVLPIGADLWVVTVTVPIEQEDSGRRELFARIAPDFRLG
ncbi:serine/threonine-protein kinase [Actinokineospora sp.]|uniref:serine/threonine-protein kinase n=1 Tax=Actinokineospora sp. TaxID=1872133 RepID=UPI004038464F